MKRLRFPALVVLVACGHAKPNGAESIAVAPKPVVAKPIEVVADGPSSFSGDVAPFELAIGVSEFCARLDGKVHCGTGDDTKPLAQQPPIGGIDDAISVALGPEFGCIGTRRGTVHCWGSNVAGQLGAKLRDERSAEPVQVAGVTNARRVFTGDEHACATTADGALWCWGLNQSGETGGATSWAKEARELVTATLVPGMSEVTIAAMTYRTTCATTKRGDFWCWGASLIEEQDHAQGQTNEHPFRLTSLSKVEDVSAGAGALCAVRAGEVWCAGSTYALIKDGGNRATPSKVDIKGATKVRIGNAHACALTRDGRVLCWGYNTNGELGREDTPNAPNQGYTPREPAPVTGIGTARDVVVGRSTSCAITGPEEAWCWGVWPFDSRGSQRIEKRPVRLRIR